MWHSREYISSHNQVLAKNTWYFFLLRLFSRDGWDEQKYQLYIWEKLADNKQEIIFLQFKKVPFLFLLQCNEVNTALTTYMR